MHVNVYDVFSLLNTLVFIFEKGCLLVFSRDGHLHVLETGVYSSQYKKLQPSPIN